VRIFLTSNYESRSHIFHSADDESDFSDEGMETMEQLEAAVKAAEDKEQPGEVEDLYHNTKFRWKPKFLQEKVGDDEDHLDADVERTPTKGESVQENENAIDLYVYHLVLTDVSLIDSRINIPNILICASFKKPVTDNSATALHKLLADQSGTRENMTFHLCTYQKHHLGTLIIIHITFCTDSCAPSGEQLFAFMKAYSSSQELSKANSISMEALNLCKVDTLDFTRNAATLIGSKTEEVNPFTSLRSLIDETMGSNVTFLSSSKGIYYLNISDVFQKNCLHGFMAIYDYSRSRFPREGHTKVHETVARQESPGNTQQRRAPGLNSTQKASLRLSIMSLLAC
jgi:hypothetical protein